MCNQIASRHQTWTSRIWLSLSALRANEIVVAQMKKAGFKNARESHGYLIQHLIESERTITELARRMEVSQQAASKSVAELIRLGFLDAVPATDRRAKRIRLSRHGWKCVRTARQLRSRIDRRLAKSLGAGDYNRTKASLIACLGFGRRFTSPFAQDPRAALIEISLRVSPRLAAFPK